MATKTCVTIIVTHLSEWLASKYLFTMRIQPCVKQGLTNLLSPRDNRVAL